MQKNKTNIIKIGIFTILFIIVASLKGTISLATDIPKVQNLKTNINNTTGIINLTWDEVKGNNDYEYDVAYCREQEKDDTIMAYTSSQQNNYTISLVPNYTYYFKVRVTIKSSNEHGEWSTSAPIKVTTKKVTGLKQVSATNKTATISWNTVGGTYNYDVRIYNSATKKYTNKTVNGTSAIIENLAELSSNKVKVRAIYNDYYTNQKIYGEYSNEINIITNPKQVSKLNTNIQSKGIKLTWNKQNGVTGYQIYRATSKTGKYSKIKTITKSSINTYIDEKVSSGKTYYYKVKAYRKYNVNTYYGKDSNIKQQIYIAAPSISVQSYNDKATIKWNKVSGTTGYIIYRANTKNGKYTQVKKIANQKTISYTDKKIKSKKEYYYKIRAYKTISGKTHYSSYSSTIQKTAYAQAKIKSVSYNSKAITIKWGKVSNVTGYEVYRANYGSNTYKKIKTLKNSTTYKDKNISVGKAYYYKIKAYKTKGKSKIYGQLSWGKLRATGSRTQQMNKLTLKPGTTGYNDLDKQYKSIIKKVTKGKRTTTEKVKACYKYIIEHMKHSDGYNCKHFSGTFAGMMKVLGIQDVYCAEGQTTSGNSWTAHTWTIINLNGTKYVFDTSIDRHKKDSTKKITYSRFFKTESEVSKKYKLSGYHTFSFPSLISKGTYGVAWF